MVQSCSTTAKSVVLLLFATIAMKIDGFMLRPPTAKTTSNNIIVNQQTVTLPFITSSSSSPSSSSSSSSALNMCICVNCARVTNCAAYHFVETKHEQPHMTEDPTFEPRDGSPTIHVNIRTIRNREDQKREMERMWREHKAETERAEQKQKEELEQNDTNNDNNNNFGEEDLHGETIYDLSPVTTYEYDVVKCADYIEEKGCWVKNMPQEIKDANPNFVPS